jgi:hypothetical protein
MSLLRPVHWMSAALKTAEVNARLNSAEAGCLAKDRAILPVWVCGSNADSLHSIAQR